MFKSLVIFLTFITFIVSGITSADGAALNPNPPSSASLIFIHHSTGENWLSDSNGGLGIALSNNNYFVSDTNYGWGPDSVGDNTDIGNWWNWFRGTSSSNYMSALYNESGQNASYSRLSTKPAGENEIIMFKSCFPNSAFQGSATDTVPAIGSNPLAGQDSSSAYHTIANAKGIYMDILEYFRVKQDKLFIVITAPPLSDNTWANNARAFNEWLINDWLENYSFKNVAVFDFYNVLTTNGGNENTNDLNQSSGNHHRWSGSAIEHITSGDDDSYPNILEYPSSDDHPSVAGNLKATSEFLPLLNIYYNCWKGTGGCPNDGIKNQIRPQIKVNNSYGPLTLDLSSAIQLSIGLYAGSGNSINADWWGYADTPFGWYYYDYVSDSWLYIADLNNFPPTYQGPLFDLPSLSLQNTTGLPAGKYTVYFGVDTNMNGQLDVNQLYNDSIVVHITQ